MEFILVQPFTLVHCSVDHIIALNRVTTDACVKDEENLPFYSSRVGPYRGDLFSTCKKTICCHGLT